MADVRRAAPRADGISASGQRYSQADAAPIVVEEERFLVLRAVAQTVQELGWRTVAAAGDLRAELRLFSKPTEALDGFDPIEEALDQDS